MSAWLKKRLILMGLIVATVGLVCLYVKYGPGRELNNAIRESRNMNDHGDRQDPPSDKSRAYGLGYGAGLRGEPARPSVLLTLEQETEWQRGYRDGTRTWGGR